MKRNYIGLANSPHDPSMAIVNSKGEVVFAEATERHLQNKRAAFISPDQFIHYTSHLLKNYIEPDAQLVIAQSWNDKSADLTKEALKQLAQMENWFPGQKVKMPEYLKRHLAYQKLFARNHIQAMEKFAITMDFLFDWVEEFNTYNDVQIRKYDHHLTHAATVCYSSPFEEACCAVLDGYGETRAYNCYHYHDHKITQIPGIIDGNGSLGSYYGRLCETCGFDWMAGEDWKVMGLAAYGHFDQAVYDILKTELRVDGLNLHQAPAAQFYNYLGKIHEMTRKKGTPALSAANIAYTGQLIFTEILYEYLNNLYKLGLSNNLAMSGGCCLNSSANGMVTEKTGFNNLFIFSAPADDGNSIGAALLAYYEDHPEEKRSPKVQSPYLGSELSKPKIEHLKRFGKIKKMKECPGDIHRQTAELLAAGKIIGWVQGKAEFGPRALGNRSILADPRSPNIKDIINDRVKFREEFRPLAPSILHEFGPEYFENYQESPYMERTLHFREEVKRKVPGVVHEDGTGRLQTVKKEWNEKYYNLIQAFYERTGIPLLLNTSFNVMGKPIIQTVEDAIAVFYTSGLDALVIGDLLIEKDETE